MLVLSFVMGIKIFSGMFGIASSIMRLLLRVTSKSINQYRKKNNSPRLERRIIIIERKANRLQHQIHLMIRNHTIDDRLCVHEMKKMKTSGEETKIGQGHGRFERLTCRFLRIFCGRVKVEKKQNDMIGVSKW